MVVVSSCTVFPSISSIRVATSPPEYRAAASLRAQSFYSCPPERSDFAQKSYFRMKTEEIWHNIEDSVLQKKDLLVYPMISTVVLERGKQNSFNFADLSVCLPGDNDPEWVVATLDVNITSRLLCEELVGDLPLSHQFGERAYLSNVCVLPTARRQGFAEGILKAACCWSKEQCVKHLYVHVVADNIAARRLYEDKLGFEVEKEEKEAVARSLNRPRRLLLQKHL